MTQTATVSVSRAPALLSDGSMTSLLEAITGEALRVRCLEQRIVRDGRQDPQIPHSARVLKRIVLLCGKHLTDGVGDSLIILDKIETYRELLACGKEQVGLFAKHFGLTSTGERLFRTTLVHYRGKPLALITERSPSHFGAHPALRIA
jgi:chorismate-pyruvate lyase